MVVNAVCFIGIIVCNNSSSSLAWVLQLLADADADAVVEPITPGRYFLRTFFLFFFFLLLLLLLAVDDDDDDRSGVEELIMVLLNDE